MSDQMTAGELILKLTTSNMLPAGLALADKQVQAWAAKQTGVLSKLATTSGKVVAGGVAAGVAVTVAAIAGLAKLGASLDDVQNKIQKNTGAQEKQLQGLMASYRKVYTEVSASSDEVAEAVGDLSKRTDQAGASLEALAKQELQLAEITGEKLNDQVRQTTRMFADWSIATTEQSAALDWLLKLNQKTGVSVTDLAERVTGLGAPLRQLGFDFATSTSLIAKWEEEGANVREITAGMKMSLQYFAEEGVNDTATAFRKVVDEIKNMEDGAARLRAVEVFGVRAGADMFSVIRDGRLDVQALLEDVKATGTTIGEAAESTKTLGARWDQLKRKAAMAFAPAAERVWNWVEQHTEDLLKALEEGDWEEVGTQAGSMFMGGLGAVIKETAKNLPAITVRIIPEIVKGAGDIAWGVMESGAAAREGILTGGWEEDVRKKAEQEGKSIQRAYNEWLAEQNAKGSFWTGGGIEGFDRPSAAQAFQVKRLLGLPMTEAEIWRAVREIGLDYDEAAELVTKNAAESMARAEAEAKRQAEITKESLLIGSEASATLRTFEPWKPGSGTEQIDEYLKAMHDLAEAERGAVETTKELDLTNEYLEETLDVLGGTMESFASRVEKAFDPHKMTLKEYAQNLQEQYDAIRNMASGTETLIKTLGDSGALSRFAAEGWDVGAVQNILTEKFGDDPRLLKAMLGADPALVEKVIQQWMNLIWTESEGEKKNLIDQQYKTGVEAADAYKEGAASKQDWSKWAKENGWLPSDEETITQGRDIKTKIEEGISGVGASLASDIDTSIADYDYEPTGEKIGSDLARGINTSLGRLTLGPPSSGPVNRAWGGPVPSYDRGGPVGLPAPRRSTGKPVLIMAHAGEWVLTENQADYMFGGAGSGSGSQMRAYAMGGAVSGDADLIAELRELVKTLREQNDPNKILSQEGQEDQAYADEVKASQEQFWSDLSSAFSKRLDAILSGSDRAEARYSMLENRAGDYIDPAELKDLQDAMTERIGFLDKAVEEAKAQLQAAKAAGAPQDVINDYASALYGLQENADSARQELKDLADVPMKQAAEAWAKSLSDAEEHIGRLGAKYDLLREQADDYLDPQELAGLAGALEAQVEAIDAMIEVARLKLEAAEKAGASQEEINRYTDALIKLEGEADRARDQLEDLAKVPLQQKAAEWAHSLDEAQQIMSLLGEASNGFALQMEYFPELFRQMEGSLGNIMERMRAATDPDQVRAAGSEAFSMIGQMFQAEDDQLRRSLDQQAEDIEESQDRWEDDWDDRAQAVEDGRDRELKALDDEAAKLKSKYDEQIKRVRDMRDQLQQLWDEQDRAAGIASLERDQGNILAQGFFTKGDVSRFYDLGDQIAEAKKQAAREAQLEELDERLKALEDAKRAEEDDLEAKRQRIEDEYQMRVDALDRDKELRAAAYEEEKKSADDHYQAMKDRLVQKYAEMLADVQNLEKSLASQTSGFAAAGAALGTAFGEGIKRAAEAATGMQWSQMAGHQAKGLPANEDTMTPGTAQPTYAGSRSYALTNPAAPSGPVYTGHLKEGFYDAGGLLYPGTTIARNATSEAEFVLTRRQLEAAARTGIRGPAGTTGPGGTVDTLVVKWEGDGTVAGRQNIDAIADRVQGTIYDRVGDKKIKWG